MAEFIPPLVLLLFLLLLVVGHIGEISLCVSVRFACRTFRSFGALAGCRLLALCRSSFLRRFVELFGYFVELSLQLFLP